MSVINQGAELDGRRLRSERSRKAIIDASLELMDEGILVPTAQLIADRASVGIRSFFRHFEDMESLFEAIDSQTRSNYVSLFAGGNRQGSTKERIEQAVERRAGAYEQVANMMLSTQAQRWRYESLRNNYARNQRALRRDLEDWLPELKKLSREEREAIDAIACFEMWHRLREHQNLSKKTSIQIVTQLLKSLLLCK